MMPKDYVNLRLTGERQVQLPLRRGLLFLINPETGKWSTEIFDRLGLDPADDGPGPLPSDILGSVTAEASAATGLPRGTPVLVGGADYPIALLGSGVCRPGLASEVAGTSVIVTLVTEKPVLDPEICNVGMPGGELGAFVLLEAGGDSARWARRAFHGESLGYGEILDMAASARVGSDALFFLPILSASASARIAIPAPSSSVWPLAMAYRRCTGSAQGVAFAVNRHLAVMERATGTRPEILIASGGGAKADLWLQIKAAVYRRPILIPEEPQMLASSVAPSSRPLPPVRQVTWLRRLALFATAAR